MSQKTLNDFIVEIFQDFSEIESALKITKDSICNENSEITLVDVGNILEIVVAKISNTKIALEKYINSTF